MMQLARGTSRVRDGGNRVLEDQLVLRARLEEQRKLVEALNPSQKLGAVDQVYGHRGFLAAREIQKAILNILRCLL